MVLPTARYAPGLDAHLRHVESLSLDPKNARAHDDRNLQAIADSLRRFGQQKPIVVAPDGTVLAGNGTLAAAKHLGWAEIAAITTDLEGPDARGFAIADNRTAELAEWDVVQLSVELEALPPEVFQTLGFDEKEMRRIAPTRLSRPSAPCRTVIRIIDQVPEPPEEATTKPGDVWILGDHRLLCGDSSKPEDVDRLLDGARHPPREL